MRVGPGGQPFAGIMSGLRVKGSGGIQTIRNWRPPNRLHVPNYLRRTPLKGKERVSNNVWAILSKIKEANRLQMRSCFAPNNREVRDVLILLQKQGWISRFVAVNNSCGWKPTESPTRFLVFTKLKVTNKRVTNINGITWYRRPVSYHRAITSQHICRDRATDRPHVYMWGCGDEFIQTKEGWLSARECALRNIGGRRGFKIF